MVASEVNEPGGLRRCVREEGLAKAISRRESTLFSAIVNGEEKLAQDVARELSWRAESAWALLWSLGRIEPLEDPTNLCDARRLVELVPSPGEPVEPFLAICELRDVGAVLDELDFVFRAHGRQEGAAGRARAERRRAWGAGRVLRASLEPLIDETPS